WGWRWMFLMNAPIGVIAIIGAFRYIPDDRARASARPDLDPVGTILRCVAILGIMLPFIARGLSAQGLVAFPAGLAVLGVTGRRGSMLPFLERGVSVLVWPSCPAGLLVLGVWWMWERHYKRRGHSPVVDTAIFANQAFRNGILIVAVYFLGATSVWIIVPLYLQ